MNLLMKGHVEGAGAFQDVALCRLGSREEGGPFNHFQPPTLKPSSNY
jgi:hypothetical protein